MDAWPASDRRDDKPMTTSLWPPAMSSQIAQSGPESGGTRIRVRVPPSIAYSLAHPF